MSVEELFWLGVKVPKAATSREIASLIYGPTYDVQTAISLFIMDAKMYTQIGPVNDRKLVVKIETTRSHLFEMLEAIKQTPGYRVLWVVDNIRDLNLLGQKSHVFYLQTSVLE